MASVSEITIQSGSRHWRYRSFINKNYTHPTQPPARSPNADAATTIAYEEGMEMFSEWKKADTEVHHYIISTIPDSRIVETANKVTTLEVWSAICIERKAKP